MGLGRSWVLECCWDRFFWDRFFCPNLYKSKRVVNRAFSQCLGCFVGICCSSCSSVFHPVVSAKRISAEKEKLVKLKACSIHDLAIEWVFSLLVDSVSPPATGS